MKILKRGFTLAEVLVTMALIGVVAAMTVPTVMMDGKYKQYVAKIAKFNSSLESAATEYAVTHDEFNTSNKVLEFAQRSFIYQNSKESEKVALAAPKIVENAVLKDGTIISIYLAAGNISLYGADTEMTGDPYFKVFFNPNVPGMSGFDNSLGFAVSEKGYVFPASETGMTNNTCLKALYDNKWKYSPSLFKTGGACKTS